MRGSNAEARRFTVRRVDAEMAAAYLFDCGASAVFVDELDGSDDVVALVADVPRAAVTDEVVRLLLTAVEDVAPVGWSPPASDVTVGRLRVIAPDTPPQTHGAATATMGGRSAPIVIDAAHAFGSGSHATTRLCLLGIQWEADRRRRDGSLRANRSLGTFLDVGTGTGLLAIAAAREGFAPVHAVEHEPAAIATAGRNFAKNGTRVELTRFVPSGDRWSFVVANMLTADLRTIADDVEGAVEEGGILLRGGVTSDELASVADRHDGWDELWRSVTGEWAALALRRRPHT